MCALSVTSYLLLLNGLLERVLDLSNRCILDWCKMSDFSVSKARAQEAARPFLEASSEGVVILTFSTVDVVLRKEKKNIIIFRLHPLLGLMVMMRASLLG